MEITPTARRKGQSARQVRPARSADGDSMDAASRNRQDRRQKAKAMPISDVTARDSSDLSVFSTKNQLM